MNTKSILLSIYEAVCAIKWKTKHQQNKAHLLCQAMFNQFVIDKARFSDYKTFSSKYFQNIFPSKRDLVIKDRLIAESILQTDNSYNVIKRLAKGYRFHPNFFGYTNRYNTITAYTHSTISTTSTTFTISYLFPHFIPCPPSVSEGTFLTSYITTNMTNLTFDEDIDDYIEQLANITKTDLTINNNITDAFIYLQLDKKRYRYSLKEAIKLSKEVGKDLIQYNDHYYLDSVSDFIIQKETQRKIAYYQSIYNLKNHLYYCSRNTTNNRLDYNLTGLKKELFGKLYFEGEPLVELDIANAQFAIAAHINQAIDPHFLIHTQNGTLYSYIESKLQLRSGDGKKLMFRIAFDKVKNTTEFNQIRQLFPLYSDWADSYKRDNKNYKLFANLLQKKEAQIMIDGLLPYLASKRYRVFTIHDALRVKTSQADEITQLMQAYFNQIGFNCLIRQK